MGKASRLKAGRKAAKAAGKETHKKKEIKNLVDEAFANYYDLVLHELRLLGHKKGQLPAVFFVRKHFAQHKEPKDSAKLFFDSWVAGFHSK